MENKYTFLFIIIVSVLIISGIRTAKAQTFSLSEVDFSNYPRLKAPFAAVDYSGMPYQNLSASDFSVSENGIDLSSSVDIFCTDTLINPAVSVVLVLDQSNSMDIQEAGDIRRWDWVKEGATSFINMIDFENSPDSRIAITSFSGLVYLRCSFTNDRKTLIDSINKIEIGGPTRYNLPFLDTQNGAIALLKSRPANIRRVIVFLTDGLPNEQPMTDSIIKALKAANIQVFSITLAMPMEPNIKQMALQTGGRSFEVYTKEALNNIYRYIAMDIQIKQYCELYWTSPYACSESERKRNLKVIFNKTGYQIDREYTLPDTSIAEYAVASNYVSFGDPPANSSSEQYINIKAKNADLSIEDIYIQPSTFFQIIDYNVGKTPHSPPYVIKKDSTVTLRVRFNQAEIKKMRQATMIINGSPCPKNLSLLGGVQQIIITNPVGGEVYSTCDSILIEWVGVEPTQPVKLSYSCNNGSSWTTITSNAINLKYYWKPPSVEINYLLKAEISQTTSYLWAKNFGGIESDSGISVAVTNDDIYLYCVGSFTGDATFGDTTVHSAGKRDMFIVKMDSDGSILWVKTAGGPGDDYATGVCVDTAGNAYVSGVCHKGFVIGLSNPILESNNTYCVLARFPADGYYPAATYIGTISLFKDFAATGNKIKYDNGYLYLSGSYNNQMVFYNYNYVCKHSWCQFTAIYDESMTLINLSEGFTDDNNYSKNYCYDSKNNKYETGAFTGTLTSGTYKNTSNGAEDIYIRKYGIYPGSAYTIESTFSVIQPNLSLKYNNIEFPETTLGDIQDEIYEEIICNDSDIDVEITELSLTGANPDEFSIVSNLDGYIIHPGECVYLELSFMPEKPGKREATLVIKADCISDNYLYLAGYGSCTADVQDSLYFGNVLLAAQKTLISNCAFKNTTLVPQLVTISKSGSAYFSVEPLGDTIVEPNSCIDMSIMFSPETEGNFSAEVLFSMQTDCPQEVMYLSGTAVDENIIIEPLDFGKRRIRTINDSILLIINNGSKDELITDIGFDSPTTQFELYSLPVFPIPLNAKDTARIPYRFAPDEEAPYSCIVNVMFEGKTDALTTTVSGSGMLPKLNIYFNCGEPILPESSVNIVLNIHNPSSTADLYVHSIDFYQPTNEFSFINPPPTDFIVHMGANYPIDMVFTPHYTGERNVEFLIKSDAATGPEQNPLVDSIVRLYCEATGLSTIETLDFNNTPLCSNNTFYVSVINLSATTTVDIIGFYFDSQDSTAFSVTLPDETTISARDSILVGISFLPIEEKDYTVKLYLVNSLGMTIGINLKGSGIAPHYYSTVTNIKSLPGKNHTIPVNVRIPALTSGSIDTLAVEIKANKAMLKYIDNSFVSKLPQWVWDGPEILNNSIRFYGKGYMVTPFDGEVFTIDFLFMLTDSIREQIMFKPLIEPCITSFYPGTVFELDAICNLSSRLVITGNTPYDITKIAPNPASEFIEFSFGIGFEGLVKIDIVNTIGEVAATPVDEVFKSGTYHLKLPTDNLSDGLYFLRFSSGGFFDTKTFILKK